MTRLSPETRDKLKRVSTATLATALFKRGFRNHDHPQRKAIEECPSGAVLVIDSRKDARAASAGGILVTRLMARGVAGIVCAAVNPRAACIRRRTRRIWMPSRYGGSSTGGKRRYCVRPPDEHVPYKHRCVHRCV
jgi:hypothetical protein